MYNYIYILRHVDINIDMTLLRFLTFSNIQGRKTVFIQALKIFEGRQTLNLKKKIFKLNPYNAYVEIRISFFIFVIVRE